MSLTDLASFKAELPRGAAFGFRGLSGRSSNYNLQRF